MPLSYVLMTSARNESKYIEGTLKSVVSQKVFPQKWVVISDGSTDGTDEIIQKYANQYSFIQYVRAEPNLERNFASKVFALQIALNIFKNESYDIIGNLDADITFEPNYFVEVLKRFENDSELGVAGGVAYEEHGGKIVPLDYSFDMNVLGANQNFRKTCFEQIGGYRALLRGGEDALADLMSRMYEWKVRSFPELQLMHHRPMGVGEGRLLKAKYGLGRLDYSFGYHPLYEIAKCISRLKEPPLITGSIARLLGYSIAALKRESLAIPKEAAMFLRKEQLQRLNMVSKNKS